MNGTFLYPESGISPHNVHKTWAMTVCKNIIETPMGVGRFDVNQIPDSDFLIIESLYSLPFAKRYKQKYPRCKIISIIADTSFWGERHNLRRMLFYRLYLRWVDGFIAVSEKIRNDAKRYTRAPVVVVRPFIANKISVVRKKLNRSVLFIGNATEEKGFRHAIEALKRLPQFDLYLVGTCDKKIDMAVVANYKNIHVEGAVPSLKKYFASCTYYLHPADFDPSPVTVWEAMYAGLIPIISKNVGQSELFDEKLRMLLLEDTRPETIAAKLAELDKLPFKEKKALMRACSCLASKYTKEKNVPKFKTTFIKLLKAIGR